MLAKSLHSSEGDYTRQITLSKRTSACAHLFIRACSCCAMARSLFVWCSTYAVRTPVLAPSKTTDLYFFHSIPYTVHPKSSLAQQPMTPSCPRL